MTLKDFMLRTSQALACALVCACVLVGCDRKDAPAAVEPTSPASYMNDTNFMARVKAQESARRSVMKRYAQAKKALEAAKKAKAKAEELAALQKRLDELEAEFQQARQKMLEIVRQRIKPQSPKKQ